MGYKMIFLFILSLFITLLLVRLNAHLFHDFKAYDKKGWKGSKFDKSKTITGVLRRKTGFEIHHIHIGTLILIVIFPIIFVYGLNQILTILLAISLSLIADQITPLISKENYFSREKIIISIIFHIIIACLFCLIYYFRIF